VSSFVWLLTLSYLYLELTTDERSMGVFILPVIAACRLFRPSIRDGVAGSGARQPVVLGARVVAAVCLRELRLAGLLGATYMLQFKEIKKKHLGYFYTRLPSLQILDVMNSRAVTVGWIFLTLGVIVGACGPRRHAASRRTIRTSRRCRSTTRRFSSRC
jgi:ABC-type transport system involved in cytochrome c biogenesis permease subunit